MRLIDESEAFSTMPTLQLQTVPSLDWLDDESSGGNSFKWEYAVYILVGAILMTVCCPMAYCLAIRYRRRRYTRHQEKTVTMPRIHRQG